MKTYHLVDKDSNIVILCSAENNASEKDVREFVKERVKYLNKFRIEEIEGFD